MLLGASKIYQFLMTVGSTFLATNPCTDPTAISAGVAPHLVTQLVPRQMSSRVLPLHMVAPGHGITSSAYNY